MAALEDFERPVAIQEPVLNAQVEHQLRESEQRFLSLFYDAPVACHEIDQHGTVLRVNPAECALLGFQASEMIGRPIWQFMAPDERDRSSLALRRKISGEEKLVPLEREYTRQDGTSVFLEIHPKLLVDADGIVVGIRSFMFDITARKRAEQALQAQASELSRSNGELEQFAYVASHDLQEPLRKILAFGDRLKSKCGPALGTDGLDYLTRMQNAAARMQLLITDLLVLSRVTSHSHPFGPVDLAEIARGVLSDLESRIEQMHAQVNVGPLPAVIADRMQMSQLFQNLISNALKFHKPGEAPIVTVRAECVGSPETGIINRITVEDNGIGFEAKYADRIFQIFQRLHGRNEYEGTGIGLAICRKIAERHGGTINVASEPGVGTKFTVMLPHRAHITH